MTYEGHSLAVYKVKFNQFDSETFVSASADWSVKVWNTKIKSALLTFELCQSLVDVIWSPFNSTVFIASSLYKIFVFDLRVNRHQAISENKPFKVMCTNLAINWQKPILLVGDSMAGIGVYKISDKLVDPNVVKSNEYLQKEIETLKQCIKMGSMIDT